MKRFLCAFASFLIVAAISVAADPVIGTKDSVNGIQHVHFKIVQAKKDDKIDKTKLIGTWEAKMAVGLPGGTWEFNEDGTLKLSQKFPLGTGKGILENGNEVEFKGIRLPPVSIGTGKYEIDGNKLTITLKIGKKEKKETTFKVTVTKLTDKEFQTKDEKGNVSKFTNETED
jgi:hypothetical protein